MSKDETVRVTVLCDPTWPDRLRRLFADLSYPRHADAEPESRPCREVDSLR